MVALLDSEALLCGFLRTGNYFRCLCVGASRRRIQHAQLMKGPNKIVLTMDDITFLNTQNSKKVRGNKAYMGGFGK